MKKLVLALSATAALFSVSVEAREAQDIYNKTCIACHASGAAGSPKTGDAAAWAPRVAKGIDTLVTHAKTGFNAMPPKGMCMDCTDAEFKSVILFMSKAKK